MRGCELISFSVYYASDSSEKHYHNGLSSPSITASRHHLFLRCLCWQGVGALLFWWAFSLRKLVAWTFKWQIQRQSHNKGVIQNLTFISHPPESELWSKNLQHVYRMKVHSSVALKGHYMWLTLKNSAEEDIQNALGIFTWPDWKMEKCMLNF